MTPPAASPSAPLEYFCYYIMTDLGICSFSYSCGKRNAREILIHLGIFREFFSCLVKLTINNIINNILCNNLNVYYKKKK